MKTQLLIIDPQNDFCDLPDAWCPPNPTSGALLRPCLPVSGAHADMQRLAQWLRREAAHIDAVTLTLDSHQRWDIAHPPFWADAGGQPPAPFTPITAAEVRAGKFEPRDRAARARVLEYLDALEKQGRYTHMVWPVHCEVGSWGHGVHADVLAACGHWQQQRQRAVQHVFKGLNPWTEHYSAVQAEVPDAADPATLLNAALLHRLGQAETLIIAGEAGSHCVRATVEHLVQHLAPSLDRLQRPLRLVLLTDAMSAVAGFEHVQADFLAAMQQRGLGLARCAGLGLAA